MLLSRTYGVDKLDRPSSEISLGLFERWGKSLINCLPRWLRRLFGTEPAELIIDASGVYWQVNLRRYSKTLYKLENLEWDNLSKLRDILNRAHRLKAKIVLMIPEREVLTRKIHFPTETPDRLRKNMGYKSLSYELDRLTPFTAQDVYHEFHFLSNPSTSYLEVELAVARRAIVDENLKLLREIGGAVDVVNWPNAWTEANLLPFKQRRRISNTGRNIRLVLIFMLIILAAAEAVSPLIQKHDISIDLSSRADKSRRAANRVIELRALIEQEEKIANFVIEQKRAAYYTVDLLAQLTDVVPDTAWVNMLNYNNGQVDFSGEAQQASDLIELLAKKPTFHNSTFRSPVTRTSSDIERFHIQFDYVGK